MHYRRTRDDSEVWWIKPSKLRDHLFGETVAEIILTVVACKVLEGQYSQHRSRNRLWSNGRAHPYERRRNQRQAGNGDGAEQEPSMLKRGMPILANRDLVHR